MSEMAAAVAAVEQGLAMLDGVLDTGDVETVSLTVLEAAREGLQEALEALRTGGQGEGSGTPLYVVEAERDALAGLVDRIRLECGIPKTTKNNDLPDALAYAIYMAGADPQLDVLMEAA